MNLASGSGACGPPPSRHRTQLQRFADICAGAHVLQIEHWRSLPDAPENPPPTPWWLRLGRNFHLPSYLLGSGIVWVVHLLISGGG